MPVIGKTIPLVAFSCFSEVDHTGEGVAGERLDQEGGYCRDYNGGRKVSSDAGTAAGPAFYTYRDDGQWDQLWYVIDERMEREIAEIDELDEWPAEKVFGKVARKRNMSAQRRLKLLLRILSGRCAER